MTDTPNLALPFIEASQAQKHVTHNEALRILDAAIQIAVLDITRTAPSASPVEGQRHIVAASPTGAWAGRAKSIATWQDGAWAFLVPKIGWCVWSIADSILLVYDGAIWRDVRGVALDNAARFGVNTTASAPNLLSVKSNGALFAAINVADTGTGDIRVQLSKEAAAKTASVVFSNAFSGRAEFGLTGDDDLRLKVSPNGTTWFDAIRIDRATGKVAFPASGGPRDLLTANRTYYIRSDGNNANSGLVNTSGGAFLTIQKAIDVAYGTLDLGGFNVTLQVAAGTYTAGAVVASPQVGAGSITLLGDATTPSNVVISASGNNTIAASNKAVLQVAGLKLTTTTSGIGLYAFTQGTINVIGRMEFAACAQAHLWTDTGGQIVCVGVNYTISGGSGFHAFSNNGGLVQIANNAVTLTGTPAFSGAYAFVSVLGISQHSGVTFSGTATGSRYNANSNGVVNTGGTSSTYLPGNAAGAAATGGIYM